MKRHLLFLILVVGLLFLPTVSYASDYSWPNDAIKDEAGDLIDINPEDMNNSDGIFSWLQNRQSYIFEDDVHNKPIYFFNTPNLQQNILNMLQQINVGGFRGKFSTYIMAQNPTTALQKYGYEIPTYTYVGEYPVIFLDIQQVADSVASPWAVGSVVLTGLANLPLAPLNLLGWIALSWNIGFEPPWFNFIDVPPLNAQDIKNLTYVNEDYFPFEELYNQDLASWLEKNWYNFPNDLFHAIKLDNNTILDSYFKALTSSKPQTEEMVGVQTLFPKGSTIGPGEGEIHGSQVLDQIIAKSGGNYKVVLNVLLNYALQPENKDKFDNTGFPEIYQLRNMPYDLDNMSKASRDYMQNVADPRVTMFGGTTLLGLFNVLFKQIGFDMVNACILVPTSFLCNLSSVLNSMCDLNLLKDNRVDPTVAWTGALGTFLAMALLIITIVALVINIVRSFFGAMSPTKALLMGGKAAILAGLVLSALLNPQALADVISNTASNIMSVSTTVMKPDVNFKEYYTQEATEAEISELRYWYTWHNCWAQYATGHAISEEANQFDPNQKTNEYAGYDGKTYQNPATLKGDTPINKWSAVLLEDYMDNDTNNALRAVDHFLAPTITDTGYPSFSVAKNRFYNNVDMYANVPWCGVIMALTLFVLTLFKFLCFIEFLIDFMLLLVRFALGALGQQNYIKQQFLNMLREVIKVMVFDILITTVVFTTASAEGAGYNLLVCLEAFLVFALIRHMLKDPKFPLAPALIAPVAQKLLHPVKSVKQTVNNTKAAASSMNTDEYKTQVETLNKEVKANKAKQKKRRIKGEKK